MRQPWLRPNIFASQQRANRHYSNNVMLLVRDCYFMLARRSSVSQSGFTLSFRLGWIYDAGLSAPH